MTGPRTAGLNIGKPIRTVDPPDEEPIVLPQPLRRDPET
jgi:hypothetical protein